MSNEIVTRTQVVIIGAGPTGLALAAQFLRYDIDFVILEKNEKTTPFSKALVVHARTLEIFRELHIVDEAISEGRINEGLNLFYKGKRKVQFSLHNLGEGLSPYPYALSLEQSKTEKLLVEYITSKGKVITWKSEFSHYEEIENGVSVYYKDGDGTEQKVTADYLVGCDGASSPLRHQMGLTFEGDTIPKIFYVADVKLKSTVINKSELFIFLIKKGFVIFFPMEGEQHYRIVGILPEVKDPNAPLNFEEIEQFIKDQIVSPVEFEELRWFSSYKVHSRKVSSFARGRCFLAGDAAHIHTPAGGQGMNTGIQDGYNLAWKLAFTLKRMVAPEVLTSYDTERLENAGNLLKTTDRAFEMMAGTTGFTNFIRLHVFPLIASFITSNPMMKKRIFPLISQINISYKNSFLTSKSRIGKVEAGVRIPYFTLAGGKNIFDYIEQPVFKLLFFGEGQVEELDTGLKANVEVIIFKEVPEVFGKEANFYVLLRPDNHISYIGRDFGEVEEMVRKVFLK